jgi:hypothetical protein
MFQGESPMKAKNPCPLLIIPLLLVVILLFLLIPAGAAAGDICFGRDYDQDDDIDGSDLSAFIPIFSGATIELEEFSGVFGYEVCTAPDDTDGDGISDADEANIYYTDPGKKDTDGDGIEDGDELNYWGAAWNADPDGDLLVNLVDPDSDNDLMKDGWEIDNDLDPEIDDAGVDTDGDKVSNLIEYKLATDPRDGNDIPSVVTSYEYYSRGSVKSSISVAGDQQQ